VVGKGGMKVNMVQKLCTYVCKCKNDTCGNYSRSRGRRVKKRGGGDEFKYDIFDIL
jgi:hypothetical protein